MKHYRKVLMSMALALGLVVMGSLPAAHAVSMLRLTPDIGTPVTITDGGIGDTNSDPGVVGFTGSVGAFVLNFVTSSSKPTLGTASNPQLDLFDALSLTFGTGGSLTMEFTDTDFTAPGPPSYTLGIGGETDGEITSAKAYRDATNTAFGHGELLASLATPLTGTFSDVAHSGPLALLGGPYSLTLEVVVDHPDSDNKSLTSNFNATLLANPEPGTMVLFGTGLIGLFGYGWRRRQQAA